MGRLSTGAVEPVRATHTTVLRRQTGAGDSTLVVHWHHADRARVWRYSGTTSGGVFSPDTTHARLLGTPAHNLFCSGHANLHDGRHLVIGGTAQGYSSVVGTTDVSSLDPNKPDLWTATSHWVVEDSMGYDRWYPTLTQLGNGGLIATSGVEYFEMLVLGGASPADSSSPFRDFRSLGLSRFPAWRADPMNRTPPNPVPPAHPKLRDHVTIPTGQQQFHLHGGRGVIVTFGGIDETGDATNTTWWTRDMDVDLHNGWRTEPMPIASGDTLPQARSQHAAVIAEAAPGLGSYEMRMFIFGGKDSAGNALGDVWHLNIHHNGAPATWQQLAPGGTAPLPRYGHTAVFDPGALPGSLGGGLPSQRYPKMIVFGGKLDAQTWASTDTVFFLQLWEPYQWHALVLSGSKPGPRYRHAAAMDRDIRPGQTRMRMSIFGGASSGSGLLQDTWTLSRSLTDSLYGSWVWYQNAAGTAAPAVYKHSLVHDEQWNRLLTFGGDRTRDGTSSEDANTGGETNECFVRTMDMLRSDSAWTQLATASPILRRSGHSAIYYWNKSVNTRVPERYEPLAAAGQRWSAMTGSPKHDDTYPFMFEIPDGRFFYGGRLDSSKVLPSTLTGEWGDEKLAGVNVNDIAGATAVQYLPAGVLKVGADVQRTKSVAARASFGGGSHQWDAASNLNFKARGNPNATMLPNGQVLVTGGRKADENQDGLNGAAAVREPQAWAPPPIDAWTAGGTALALEPVNRGYHSTAILLPDARVLSAGGEFGPNPALHDAMFHGTIFEPPYLFDPNSAGGNGYASRPTIDIAPKFVGHGCPFEISVTASNGVSSICLIRPGAVTHAFNQDQRYVPLTFTQNGSTVTVDAPADALSAPPGDYLLFVLDNTSRKVPSVASWVRVTESIGPHQAADADRPTRVTNLGGANGREGPGCSQPITVTWAAPRDDSLPTTSGRVRKYDLRYSTSPICDNCWSAFAAADTVSCEPTPWLPGQTQSVKVGGLGIGSYVFRMVGQDDRSATGNGSAMSNSKTLLVLGCEEGFTGGGGGGGGGSSARWVGEDEVTASDAGTSENSLLADGAGSTADFLRLPELAVETGQLMAYLRRGATGETHVQEVALVVADHALDAEVVRIGSTWRQARRAPVVSATSPAGVDLTSYLSGDPDAWLVGDSGDTVLVTLPPAEVGDTDGAIYLEAHAGRVRGVESPGLQVLARDGSGAWREVTRVLPRARFSTHAVTGVTGDQFLLAFRGNHGVRAAGRLMLGGSIGVSRTSASSATHSTLGTLDPAAVSAGSGGVTVGARERLDLAFDVPAPGATEARSYFLEVTGASVSGDALEARARPEAGGAPLPTALQLGHPVPNPFTTGTSLRLGLPEATMVRVDLYDLAGRRVATVMRGRLDAGWHTVAWDGRSRAGTRAAAGIYMLRVTAGTHTFDRRLVVMP